MKLSKFVFIASLFLFYLWNAGCEQTSSSPTSTGDIDLKQAISLAIEKLEEVESVQEREFDLKVRKSKGSWRFSFSFNPKSPGGHIYVVVSTNGDIEVMPGM